MWGGMGTGCGCGEEFFSHREMHRHLLVRTARPNPLLLAQEVMGLRAKIWGPEKTER